MRSRLGVSGTVGLRVFVCHNLAFQRDYSSVLAKHSKHFSLEDSLSVGVGRMQRNFEPMRRQVESWRAQQLSPSAFKELDPIPQFRATAKLGRFLEAASAG